MTTGTRLSDRNKRDAGEIHQFFGEGDIFIREFFVFSQDVKVQDSVYIAAIGFVERHDHGRPDLSPLNCEEFFEECSPVENIPIRKLPLSYTAVRIFSRIILLISLAAFGSNFMAGIMKTSILARSFMSRGISEISFPVSNL